MQPVLMLGRFFPVCRRDRCIGDCCEDHPKSVDLELLALAIRCAAAPRDGCVVFGSLSLSFC